MMTSLARRVPALLVGRQRLGVSSSVNAKQVRRMATAAAPPLRVDTRASVSLPSDASAGPTQGRRARQMLHWHWLSQTQRSELEAYVSEAGAAPPSWLEAAYQAGRTYRTARSRRWRPSAQQTGGDVEAFIARACEDMRASCERGEGAVPLAVWDALRPAEQADIVLQPVWMSLSDAEREAAMVRVTYECVRRLGWRSGFSSGYPGAPPPSKDLRATGAARTAARRSLQEREEARAWAAWQALSSEERRLEWETAWRLRDRSLVYIDDGPATQVLGAPLPRWYATPQRAGTLTFLPNIGVRLVRNYTPRGKPYDAWKATFRVPLTMHKHMLRSYLLAVYGLRTTWARSMVYRSPITYSRKKQRRMPGTSRTFKKVEIGLLEPFVFPTVTKEFMRTHLFTQEMQFEERRLMLKMTKGRRWRSHKTVADLSRAIDRNYEAQNAGAAPEPAGERPTAQLLTRKGSVPTARHGHILSAIAARRAQREARVQALLDEQRASKAK